MFLSDTKSLWIKVSIVESYGSVPAEREESGGEEVSRGDAESPSRKIEKSTFGQ